MKKIISILLLILLMFSLSACKKENTTPSKLDTNVQSDISSMGASIESSTSIPTTSTSKSSNESTINTSESTKNSEPSDDSKISSSTNEPTEAELKDAFSALARPFVFLTPEEYRDDYGKLGIEFNSNSEITAQFAAEYMFWFDYINQGNLFADYKEVNEEEMNITLAIPLDVLNGHLLNLFGKTFDLRSVTDEINNQLQIRYDNAKNVIIYSMRYGWGGIEPTTVYYTHKKIEDSLYQIEVKYVDFFSEREMESLKNYEWYFTGDILDDGYKQIYRVHETYFLTVKYVNNHWQILSFIKNQ